MKKLWIGLLLLALSVTLLPLQAQGAEGKLISVSPEKYLFEVENMKPGDWAVRELTITNKGNNKLQYETEVRFQSGSKKLFNEMRMSVESDGKLLYEGKLEELRSLEPRPLDSAQEEMLTFRLDFPSQLGNEYQGLSSNFTIEITASENGLGGGTDQAVVSSGITGAGPGGMLPNTSTNIFNFILTGLLLCGAGASMLWLYRRNKAAET